MILRGIDFGPIWFGSGTVGFFGEGYWYHNLFKWLPGFDLSQITFVAKTTTLEKKDGNMPLKEDRITPAESKPRCIKVNLLQGATLNAVGLSGPGARWLFDQGSWQNRPKPFFLSFMAVSKKSSGRLEELVGFVSLAKEKMQGSKAKWGLQINFSCPNVGLEVGELLSEVEDSLDIAAELNVPLVPKFNLSLPPLAAKKISLHPACDAIHISNTLPFGKLEGLVPNWEKLFGEESPLEDLGGGGLSGPALFPLVQNWLNQTILEVPSCPINAGGGIFSRQNVDTLFNYGAHGISISTVIMHRPWRVLGIVEEAYKRRRS